jgi:hypothetical protein
MYKRKKLTGETREFFEEAFLRIAFSADDTRGYIESFKKIDDRRFTDNRRRVIYRGLKVIDLNYAGKEGAEDEDKVMRFKKGLEAAGALELAGGCEYVGKVCVHLPGVGDGVSKGGYYAGALAANLF